jgi:adenosylmethionine-8-amino-7-oxononanoate aminotransferase
MHIPYDVRELDRRHVWHGWAPFDHTIDKLVIERGQGYLVWDAEGHTYLDAISSSLNSTCGYQHPQVVAAIAAQMAQLHHVDHGVATNSPAARLAARIAECAATESGPALTRTLFTNSGSEAVEAALRIVAEFHRHRGEPRDRVITFEAGYHGSTNLCQALSGLPHVRPAYGHPFTVTRVPLPDPVTARDPEYTPLLLAAFDAAFAAQDGPQSVAAVLVEPFINVGGGIVLPPGLLLGLRDRCAEAGALFLIDEVFTGYGRTGRMFAFQHEDATPDVLISSKGLTSGYLPLGAVTTTDAVHLAFAADRAYGGLPYGHTTSGHALACATALAVLDVLQNEGLIERAATLGTDLLSKLAGFTAYRHVRDVRGFGLVVTLEMASPDVAQLLVAAARERGLLLRVQGSAVMAMPPLIIDERGVKDIAAMLEESLAAIDLVGALR